MKKRLFTIFTICLLVISLIYASSSYARYLKLVDATAETKITFFDGQKSLIDSDNIINEDLRQSGPIDLTTGKPTIIIKNGGNVSPSDNYQAMFDGLYAKSTYSSDWVNNTQNRWTSWNYHKKYNLPIYLNFKFDHILAVKEFKVQFMKDDTSANYPQTIQIMDNHHIGTFLNVTASQVSSFRYRLSFNSSYYFKTAIYSLNMPLVTDEFSIVLTPQVGHCIGIMELELFGYDINS